MVNIQQQLDISRERARELGVQTIKILTSGYYETKAVNRIEIKDAIRKSVIGTVTYSPEIVLPFSASDHFSTKIEVLNTTTLAAAASLTNEGFQPAILNMASATSPGGGFLSGSRAQEEYLARSSGLFECLRNNLMYKRKDFHTNPFYDDFVIYSPEVIVFRDDDGELLEKPYTCSIITSPAVQANAVRKFMAQRTGEIESVMWNRILRVLAVGYKHEKKALVLGAWGCGAFGNDGFMIASLFKRALIENFKGAFERIIFAITDWSPEQRFIRPFRNIFER